MSKKTLKDLFLHLGVSKSNTEKWADGFANAMVMYDVTTKKRIAALLGNIMHECAYFTILTENLNYSATSLANTWPNRYSSTGKKGGAPNALANSIARNPQAIANNTYANRMGNGSVASGDGWKYIGRGPIQRTGKSGYVRTKTRTGIDVLTYPELLLSPKEGSIAAVDYWDDNKLNVYADKGDFDGVCDIINIGRKTEKQGDANGYADRNKTYTKALKWLDANPIELVPESKPVTLTGTNIKLEDVPLEGQGSIEL